MFSLIRAQRTTTTLRIQPTIASFQRQKHTTDSYSKEVDSTPAPDKSVHRVDPNSDLVQKPYEAPSGEWSRAGVKTDEYRSVEGEKEPYAPKGGDQASRYGARPELKDEKGKETSGSEEGPEGKASQGRGGKK